MNETIRSMAGSRTVESVSVPMSTRMIFEWTFGYHVMLTFIHDTSKNLGCIGILLTHHHAHYTEILVTDFVLLSHYCVLASPWWSHVCLVRRWLMPSHWEGPKNISPSSEEQIPLSSYPFTCQTFRWSCKLSLWSPCYMWCLSNPKAHCTAISDYDTLMV